MSDPTVETMIRRALRKRLEAYPALPPVLYPGDAEGTPTATHILASTILAPPERQFIASGKPHIRRGTLQLMMRHRPIDLNLALTIQEAGLLAAHFTDGTCMQDGSVRLKVVEYPEVSDGFADKGWWNTPIRIRWDTAA